MRRIKRNLVKPGDNLGDVRVAVHAYIYLLAKSVDDDSSYNANFFATELVSGPDAVVSKSYRLLTEEFYPGLLLRHVGMQRSEVKAACLLHS
jgi:hypothetical protein